MRYVWLILLGTALLAFSAPGRAQTARRGAAGKEPAGYREAIDTALQEVELNNFEEAREQFARAHALFPNARTLRGLGISEFELRHYVVAVDYLEQALSSEVKPLEGNLRRETEALLGRARTYIGELSVVISPGHASLTVDGVRHVAAVSQPLRLDVGSHVLELRAEGYATERREVTVRGGQAERLELRLAALVARNEPRASTSSPAPLSTPAPDRQSERVPVYKRWWLWTVIGVVVAGAAAGTVIALNNKKDHTEYRAVPSENTPLGAGLQPLWKY